MNPMFMLQLLWRRAQLKPRERWPRKRLLHHQQDAAGRLQSYAFARSPFYQRFHAGLEGAPVSKLPVLTKARLMSEYDNVVTDRAIRLVDVRQHMLGGDASGLFRGRYFVTATGGSTGQPAIVLHDRDEWLWVMASFARAADWAGMGFSLSSRRRHALVSSRTRWHQSSQLARTAEGPWLSTLRLDAGDPLDRIFKALNAFQPHVLTAYAKTARVLAESALAGDLRISPERSHGRDW
jgi:phenylacetate-CoA ligase